MKLKIAICEDEYNIQFLLEDFVQEVLNGYNLEYEIEVYSNGEEFCRKLKKNDFDLLFLDIELKEMNGIEVSKFIRETKGDETIQIAYVSGKTGYALELFEYRPINFLVKPVVSEDIKKVIDKLLLLTNQYEELFRYKKGTSSYMVPLQDIIYFSSRGRKVTIHKKDGNDEFYDTMNHIYSQLEGKRFLFVHKSYIINCLYIKLLEYSQITLTGNIKIPISQSRRQSIRAEFLSFKKGEL